MKSRFKLKGTALDKALAVACVLLLALALSLYYGQTKTSAQVAKVSQQLEAAMQNLRKAESHPSLADTQQKLARLKSQAIAYPAYAQAEETMPLLGAWAQASGVSLDQMAYTVTSTVLGDYQYHAHSHPLSGKGPPAAVSEFLRLMFTSSLRAFGIGQLQVAQMADGNWQFSLVCTVWSEATKIAKPATTGK
ncbi:MAG: hypothetical protein Q7T05_03895 [Dehalococcoidia bacterium]|nr:hypothetical protein [Dehalococcoidia bacterium]